MSALSPNAIGCSSALLKTPDSNDSIFVFISSLSFSKSTSMLVGIILNCIPAVAMISKCLSTFVEGP